MEKRFIGIDIDSRHVRVAILSQSRDALLAVGKKEYSTPEEMIAALQEMIGETRPFGDRVAAAVPGLQAFVRRVEFPFADPRKIDSALSFELAAQVPVDLDDYTVDFQAPVPTGEGAWRVTAAAVRTDYLADLLKTFDASGLSLHILELTPFALVRGLRDHCPDGILAHLSEQEITLALVRDGRVADHRLLPVGALGDAGQTARIVRRESAALQREAGRRDLPLYLVGAGATADLQAELQPGNGSVEVPRFYLDGREIDPEFLPAVALALRASVPGKEKEFNFRRGRFALKNEWTSLKRELTAAAAVLVLAFMALAGAGWLNYAHKAGRVEALQKQITQVFRSTFPGSQPMVDVPQQMRSRIGELRERGRLIGAGDRQTPLAVLQEISRQVPADITLDIRDFSYSPENVRLEGVTSSFDAINQIARGLERSDLFAEAQIADAKMSIDGSRVDFRLNLVYRAAGANR